MEERKITETGIGGLKGIRGEDLYSKLPEDYILNLGKQASQANYQSMHGHVGYEALHNPALTQVQVLDPNTQLGQLGRSQYDSMMTDPTPEEMGDLRSFRQPWHDHQGRARQNIRGQI